jgi:H+-translocating NAD(P) transhydrogenase subunit beta
VTSGLFIDLFIIAVLLVGISLFRTPQGAKRGNLAAAFALLCSILAVWIAAPVLDLGTVLLALLIGSTLGTMVANRVTMIQIPAMVAFQHGAGGVAAFLVSYLELTRQGESEVVVGVFSGLAGLVLGAATFSGSMLAGGKLANMIRQTPTHLKDHNRILKWLVAAIGFLALISLFLGPTTRWPLLVVMVILSLSLGVIFAMRIGGADMPVLISFLNATAGLAAAFCGIIIQNRLLIVCGATVAASGSILTHVMCRAMNRSLINVFVGIKLDQSPAHPATFTAPLRQPESTSEESAPTPEETLSKPEQAAKALSEANSVIIIPGYGMALAQAQSVTFNLASVLEDMGKTVNFAVHPVAGRMPGHMTVLLAEAGVDYDKLLDMDDINRQFSGTDVALVVGACDVVNPAAMEAEHTPISGMPILMAHEARHVIVCNLDEKPGYSGVPNPLYDLSKTIMLMGDAKGTLEKLLLGIQNI